MEQLAQRRLSDLSGGQQQRVLLARALMQQTGVLLLDEPCSAIDPPTREHLLSVMREQADAGQTLLVSSHDWGSALDSYDKVLVLDNKLLAQRHAIRSPRKTKRYDMHDGESLLWMKLKSGG